MNNLVKVLVLAIIVNLSGLQVKGSHIFGGELLYKHLSGYTYELTLTLYGDCSGNSYPNLFTSAPKVMIYNGNTPNSFVILNLTGVPGLEVTPVCPSEINNTKCNGGILPGVAQFIYKNTVTLSGPSTDWRFIFNGELDPSNPNSYAGRSNAITNISNGGGGTTIMALEATLNNSAGPNNSSTYTTIPTPFFCVNIPQQYNQGALDMDNDDLSFDLIPGLNGVNQLVTYIGSYTFDEPLATTPGSFSFSNQTGQMAFQPNAVQNSLVVTKVTERRNGVIVGTSMREMTVVVLNNCNNQSPLGNIVSTSLGSISAFNEIRVCKVDTTLQFTINATDPDNENVSVSVNGLPGTASYNLIGNGTMSPSLTITWNIPAGTPLGSTTFYITYQDDGCPLSSKQTIAYSVIIEQPITVTVTPENVSCASTTDGQILVNASSSNGSMTYSLNGGPFQSSSTFSNLTTGTYTIVVKDPANCSLSEITTIESSPQPELSLTNIKDISCYGKTDGSLSAASSTSGTNTFYLYPNGINNTSGLFQNLAAGQYTIVLIDNKSCKDTSFATILEPPVLYFGNISIQNLTCNKTNGKIKSWNPTFPNAVYTLSPGLKSNSDGFFDNLASGIYSLTLKTAEDCFIDTVVYVGVDPLTFTLSTTQEDLKCLGKGIEGSATVIANGGVPPYAYLWNTSPPQTSDIATNLYYGWYTVSVTDATGCELKDTIYINSGPCCETMFIPNAFSPNGDGNNDEWKITTSTGMDIDQFVIYNRYGQKIWSTIDQRHGWNGKHLNGDAEPGTYFYLLRYKCLTDGKSYTKKGDIILLK
jgi:gliding motility-associated-like protein